MSKTINAKVFAIKNAAKTPFIFVRVRTSPKGRAYSKGFVFSLVSKSGSSPLGFGDFLISCLESRSIHR